MRATPFILFYLAAFAGAEIALVHHPIWGIGVYFAVLLGLIVHSTLFHKDASGQFFLALVLVPLIRIVSIAMPVPEVSGIYWYAIIAIPILAGTLSLMRSLDLSPADVGILREPFVLQLALAYVGIGFGLVDYLILKPEPLISALTWQRALVPAIVLLATTGPVEEIVFRGVIQRTAQRFASQGWIYVALVYSILQIGQGSSLHCLFAFGVALFFGWTVRQGGSIGGVSLAHGLINVGLYLVFPFVLD